MHRFSAKESACEARSNDRPQSMRAIEKTYRKSSIFPHRKDAQAVDNREQPHSARCKTDTGFNEHYCQYLRSFEEIIERRSYTFARDKISCLFPCSLNFNAR